MEKIRGSIGVIAALAWMFIGPATYVLLIVDTWRGHGSGALKLLISLTLDPFLAALWPVTWIIWIIEALSGDATPIRLLAGG